MIQGITTGAGGGGLGYHLADRARLNEQTRPGESRGLLAEGIKNQIDELTKLAAASRAKAPVAHFHADPPPGARWTETQWARHWERVEAEFGLQRQPFAEAIHEKGGREHRHRAYSLYDPQTGHTIPLDHYKRRNEKLSRIAEFENGEAFTKGKHNRAVAYALEAEGRADVAAAIRHAGLTEGPPGIARTTPQERAQNERTHIDKKDVAAATSAAWKSADSPTAFLAAMRDQGMRIAQGDRTLLVVDQSGNSHSLTRMLSMAARADGEPSSSAAEINSRMAGAEIPTLADARTEIRTAAPAPATQAAPTVPEPTAPVPPQGPPSGITAPAAGSEDSAGAKAPAPPQQGGGGGGAATASDGAAAAILEDVGAGPGEPPGHGAGPEEIARFRAKVAAYEERKGEAILRYAKAQAAASEQRNKGSGGGHGNHGHTDGGLTPEQIKGISEAINRFDAAGRGANRAQARDGFARALAGFTRDDPDAGRRDQRGEQTSPSERAGGSPGGEPRSGHAAPDDAAGGPGRAGQDAGVDRRDDEDGRGDPQDRTEDRREAFRDRCAAARVERSLSVAHLSRLRAAVAALDPDPLDGMDRQQRHNALREWKTDLLRLYSQDREASRDEGREAWARRIADEKLRAAPVAEALRRGWRHLSPRERADGWQRIKEARQTLAESLREEARARPRFGFNEWLEGIAACDPKAAAVHAAAVASEARKDARAAALEGERVRIDRIRATAPTGERDPTRAVAAIKDGIKSDHAARERAAQDAAAAAAAARSAVWPWHNLPGMRGPLRAARAAEHRARDLELSAEIKAPTRETWRAAQQDGTALAERNQRALSAWERRHPDLPGDEKRFAEVCAAVAERDPKILKALDGGGYEAAAEIIRRREEAEERQRQRERNAHALPGARRDQELEPTGPAPAGPRMR